MEMKTSSLIVLAIVLSIIASVLLKISAVGQQHFSQVITSYDECVAAGNPIMESYPTQCRTADGRTFVNPSQQAAVPPQPQQYVQSDCKIGGCSGQICGEASEEGNLVSDCMYRPEFQCFKTARCERQATGKCGWTQTAELSSCIAAAANMNIEKEPISN